MAYHRARRTERALTALVLATLLGACGGAGAPEGWVKRISTRGNHAISSSEITEGLATVATSWWPFAEKQAYDPGALELDLRRVERLYAERGYFSTTVRSQVKPLAKGAVEIELQIVEGPRARIAKVRLEGLQGALDPASLAPELGISVGDDLDYRRYQSAKGALAARLRSVGYGYAAAQGEIQVDRARAEAAVLLRAVPGPAVSLGSLAIVGNEPISAPLLELARPWRIGDRFDPDELALLERRIYRMGVFSTVAVTLPPPPRAEPAIAVTLTPAKLRRLRLGGGIGIELRRQEARLLTEWTLRNFLGGLRTLSIRFKPALVAIPTVWDLQRSGVAIESEVELVQPYLFRTQLTAVGAIGYDLGFEEASGI